MHVTEQAGKAHITAANGAGATVHHSTNWRPFVYPLRAAGGVEVTRGYPIVKRAGESQDHPHHTSMWLAHGDVNGWDFWHDQSCRIVPVDQPDIVNDDGAVVISMDYRWIAGDQMVVALESRTLRFAEYEGGMLVDWTSRLQPAEHPILFGDTKEGTMAIRLAPELRLEGAQAVGSSLNSEGVRNEKVWGKKARWVAYTGIIEEQPITVAMFDHHENPRHPTWWHARPYGLFAANPFGRRAFEGDTARSGQWRVEQGNEVILRYRVLVTDREQDSSVLDNVWSSWNDQDVRSGTE